MPCLTAYGKFLLPTLAAQFFVFPPPEVTGGERICAGKRVIRTSGNQKPNQTRAAPPYLHFVGGGERNCGSETRPIKSRGEVFNQRSLAIVRADLRV